MTTPEDSSLQDIAISVEQQIPDTKAKRMTIAVVNAGVLPHSTNERDHAYALLGPAYRIKGGMSYIENIARLNSEHVIMDVAPQISLRAQRHYPDPLIEAERARIGQERRDQVMKTIADHMMDYVEDAKAAIDALYDLDKMMGDVLAEDEPVGPLLVDAERVHLAVATLARLHETKEYIADGSTQKSRMNSDLVTLTDDVEDRIADATRNLTIGETKKDIIEALRLEIERMNFWTDQLFGHPNQPSRQLTMLEPGDYDEPAVQKRYGVIDTKNPLLRGRVLRRMSLIELGGAVSTYED